jgi:gliding-associated putative ABC transporter substrate-binding component GldG
MNKKKSIAIYLILIAGILILINILASRFFFRLDLTGDKRYTLSEATRNILAELDDPVTVTAYFSEGLPPQIAQARNAFKDLLTEYKNASKGNIHFEFINPNQDEKTEQEAAQAGISPVLISVREKNEAVQKKAYLGAVVKYGDKTETIPFLQQGTAMEYSFSTAIKKLTVEDKPLIGFIQGHGEPSVGEFQQAMQELNVLYEVQSVNMTDSTNLLKYKTICLISPRDTVPEDHLHMLDQYLSNGGNIYLALNRVEGELNQGMGFELNTGLESWLQKKGLELENSFVLDANCGNITVRQQQGMFTFERPVSFPYLPIATTFAENSMVEGLENVIFQFVSPINYTGDSALRFLPLVKSSGQSAKQQAPIYFDVQREWNDNDFTLKELTLAAMLEGKIEGSANSRIILVGDGDFAVNGYGEAAHALNPDNVNLMVNSIDFLSDDTGLIALRTKGINSRPLEQVEDGTKTTLKYLNFLLPIILIIVYGIIRNQKNRIIRNKRMQEHFY